MLKRLLAQLKFAAERFLRKHADNYVHYLSGQEQLPAPLTKEEEEAAFKLMDTDFDKARDTLIVHNLRLVVYIAKKPRDSSRLTRFTEDSNRFVKGIRFAMFKCV